MESKETVARPDPALLRASGGIMVLDCAPQLHLWGYQPRAQKGAWLVISPPTNQQCEWPDRPSHGDVSGSLPLPGLGCLKEKQACGGDS